MMVKADGSVLVHADAGGYKPLNWMTPPTVVEERAAGSSCASSRPRTSWRSGRRSPVGLTHAMDFDAGGWRRTGWRPPPGAAGRRAGWCGEGCRLVRREWPTTWARRPDVPRRRGRGSRSRSSAQSATMKTVEQLRASSSGSGWTPHADCRGVLAAQSIKKSRPPVRRPRKRARVSRVRSTPAAGRRPHCWPAVRWRVPHVRARCSHRGRGRGLSCDGINAARSPQHRQPIRDRQGKDVAAALERHAHASSRILTGAGRLLRGDGPRGVRRPGPCVEGRGFAGIASARREAADRRDRGVRRRGRARGGAGVRPDRRGPRRPDRDPRGQALAGRLGRRAAAAAGADPVPRGDGAGADGRPDRRRARPRPGLVNRLAEPGGALDAALELAGAIVGNGPCARGDQARLRDARLGSRGGLGAPGARSPGPCSRPRTRARVRWRSRRSASRSGAGADAAPAGAAISRKVTPPSASRSATARPAVAVLAQVDPLPGPEREAPVAHRQGERRPEQRGLDVRGHVVGALDRVRPVAARPRARRGRTRPRSRRARRARRSR